ncbi:DUF3298 and DUF4163 domain-containing protein [Maribacter algarum]|uniref:DUF3298 and DUF4163 domain-containing protein n=1 Tax=Maribacter algarum (ex Zhang et al. 2020) TaxID=2578118 RepID=A0A5S3PW53_9FLAO|nr:DUF3298 and DUF4163 domain-containing protein [Maribacter algarum]TMM59229.1 DUF3298 and DUF4163 domain-containing protein [Maribacter algarum]
MKSILYYLLVFLLLYGCQSESKLTFEPHTFKSDSCAECPEVSIAIPKALGPAKISKTINVALEEEIISLLSFDDELEVTSLEDALKSFKSGYLELQQLYDDEPTGWEAKIEGSISYEDANFITIILDSYLFTGGAHGYTSKQFLNFDKKKGIELDNDELFKNTDDFRMFAEEMFREKEKIPKDKSINHTGFMFEQDSFYLPENIGFTQKGMTLLYNPYEVASYADGAIELVLPHEDIKKYLAKKPKS